MKNKDDMSHDNQDNEIWGNTDPIKLQQVTLKWRFYSLRELTFRQVSNYKIKASDFLLLTGSR